MASLLPRANAVSDALNPGKRHDAVRRGEISYFPRSLSLVVGCCLNPLEYCSRKMQNRGTKNRGSKNPHNVI